jgi:hypothetical protein
MRFQPLLQQFNQHRSRLSLSLGEDLSNERLNCIFNQNSQDYVRVHADRVDRLSEDALGTHTAIFPPELARRIIASSCDDNSVVATFLVGAEW